MVNTLMLYGLTQLEAERFVSLLDLIQVPEEDRQLYEEELIDEEPFAGQLSDTEAIIALKVARELEITLGVDNEEEDIWTPL